MCDSLPSFFTFQGFWIPHVSTYISASFLFILLYLSILYLGTMKLKMDSYNGFTGTEPSEANVTIYLPFVHKERSASLKTPQSLGNPEG